MKIDFYDIKLSKFKQMDNKECAMEEGNINIKLKELRRARGLTVNKLAEKMGENYQKVGRIERGKSNLTIDYLLKVSKALKTPLDAIFSNDSVSESHPEPTPDLLNEIVLFVEKNQKNLIPNGDPQKKAMLITKIYQAYLSFPEKYQSNFIKSLFEILNIISQ